MPRESLLSGQTLGITGDYLSLQWGWKAGYISESLLLESISLGNQLGCSLGGTMSHPFPRNGPGSLRAAHHPWVGLRQNQHSACTTDLPACSESPVLRFTRALHLLWISQGLLYEPSSLIIMAVTSTCRWVRKNLIHVGLVCQKVLTVNRGSVCWRQALRWPTGSSLFPSQVWWGWDQLLLTSLLACRPRGSARDLSLNIWPVTVPYFILCHQFYRTPLNSCLFIHSRAPSAVAGSERFGE